MIYLSTPWAHRRRARRHTLVLVRARARTRWYKCFFLFFFVSVHQCFRVKEFAEQFREAPEDQDLPTAE